MFRRLIVGVLALALPWAAFAGATVRSLTGDGQAGGAPLAQGQRVVPPAAVSTGAGAQVFLQFDDGMQIVLHENSLLRIIDFRYTSSGVTDRAVLELLRGAARVVTGKIALDNRKQFFFRTPQTQLTVERPADFTVALVNPAYITVHSGALLSSNGWGTVTLNAGSLTTVAGNAAAPAAISTAQLPASASAAMKNLSVASVTGPTGGAASGVAGTAGGVAGAGFVGPIIFVGAAVAGAAVATGDDGEIPAATTHH